MNPGAAIAAARAAATRMMDPLNLDAAGIRIPFAPADRMHQAFTPPKAKSSQFQRGYPLRTTHLKILAKKEKIFQHHGITVGIGIGIAVAVAIAIENGA
jgi:hypothetical protein